MVQQIVRIIRPVLKNRTGLIINHIIQFLTKELKVFFLSDEQKQEK
jgi:hypothetical protein